MMYIFLGRYYLRNLFYQSSFSANVVQTLMLFIHMYYYIKMHLLPCKRYQHLHAAGMSKNTFGTLWGHWQLLIIEYMAIISESINATGESQKYSVNVVTDLNSPKRRKCTSTFIPCKINMAFHISSLAESLKVIVWLTQKQQV